MINNFELSKLLKKYIDYFKDLNIEYYFYCLLEKPITSYHRYSVTSNIKHNCYPRPTISDLIRFFNNNLNIYISHRLIYQENQPKYEIYVLNIADGIFNEDEIIIGVVDNYDQIDNEIEKYLIELIYTLYN